MTDNDIIIAVAKMDPYHKENDTDSIFRDWRKDAVNWTDETGYNRFVDWLVCNNKDYLESRDAIIPVIKKCITTYELQHVFNYALYPLLDEKTSEQNGFTYVMAVLATPKQLCIALLKATGKWIDCQKIVAGLDNPNPTKK